MPEIPPCPWCDIEDDDISLSIAPEYDGYEIENVSVQIFDAAGASEHRYYGPLSLSSTTPTVVSDPGLLQIDSTGQPPVRAVVTMTFVVRDATGQVVRTFDASNPITVKA